MPRTDDDSWDITESVGSTALGVAAARAAETDSDVSATTMSEMLVRYGRSVPDQAVMPPTVFVSAQRSGG